MLMSKEILRYQTPTQKACKAVKEWNVNKPINTTQKEHSDIYGVSKANFANAQYIYKHNRDIFDGAKVNVSLSDKYSVSDSLNTIVKYLKSLDLAIQEDLEIDEKAMTNEEKKDYELLRSRINSEFDFFKLKGMENEIIAKVIKKIYSDAIDSGIIEKVGE